jgi:hypothetical protein
VRRSEIRVGRCGYSLCFLGAVRREKSLSELDGKLGGRDHRSPISNHRSPITDHRSPITDHRSPITDHQSPITNHQSPITNHQSPSPALPPRVGRNGERKIIDCQRRFFDSFAHRWVSVNRTPDILCATAEFHYADHFRNKLRRATA